jgi:hypothetical protein
MQPSRTVARIFFCPNPFAPNLVRVSACPKGQLPGQSQTSIKGITQSLMTTITVPPPFESAPPVNPPVEPTPFLTEFFMVQGPGFRCMAYYDRDGKWRNAFNNEELYGKISILE